MPFEKVNIKQIIGEKKQKNPEFAKAYSEVEKEYELVRQIVRIRKTKRITQRELAQRIGIHQQVISRFEREKHIPTLIGFLKILNGLDLDFNLVEKDTKEKQLSIGPPVQLLTRTVGDIITDS